MSGYNWLYTVWNNNAYLLLFIVFILICIIVLFNLHKRKSDNFYNINTQFASASDITNANDNNNAILFANIDNIAKLDGNDENTYTIYTDNQQEQLTHPSQTNIIQNDILQVNSNLYTQDTINQAYQNPQDTMNTQSAKIINNTDIEDYISIDNIGNTMTDTIGGINSNLGFTLLDEIPKTLKAQQQNNPNTYDNTQTYYTGFDPNKVNGIEGNNSNEFNMNNEYKYKLVGKDDKPIIMQKDFSGVANIFAPNIYISNPPLTSNGYPDISYSV